MGGRFQKTRAVRFLLLILLVQPALAGQDWIVRRSGGWQLQLPSSLRQALPAGFQPWTVADYIPYVRSSFHYSPRQLPFAVAADFNGDGKRDLIVDGRTSTASLRLALLSPGYRATVLEKAPLQNPQSQTYEAPGPDGKIHPQRGLWVYLEHLPPGRIERPVGDQPPLQLKHDGYQVVYLMKTTILYRYLNGKFEEIYNAD